MNSEWFQLATLIAAKPDEARKLYEVQLDIIRDNPKLQNNFARREHALIALFGDNWKGPFEEVVPKGSMIAYCAVYEFLNPEPDREPAYD